MSDALDNFDLKILALLQQDNQRTLDDLSRLVNLSSSACRRRVEAMRRANVIIRDVAVVDPAAVGRPLLALALVKLERDAPDAHKTFRAVVQGRPEIMQAFFTAGSSDYVLLLNVRTVDEYRTLTESVFTPANYVRYFETMIVMSRVKWTMAVQIDATPTAG